jgi:hypothetical protein
MGKFSAKPLQTRFRQWTYVPRAMLQYAQEKGLEKEWGDVVALAKDWLQLEWTTTTGSWPDSLPPKTALLLDRPVYGPPMIAAPLAHAPTTEAGVIFLFGTLASQLGYMVTLLRAGFPDCEAMREVEPEKWQRVRIEFEHESRNFLRHMHQVRDCDMIVCWNHNWPECPLEVLALKKVVGRMKAAETAMQEEEQEPTADEQ